MSARLLNVRDAAAMLGCGKDHVYGLISDGVLPVVDIARDGHRPRTRVSADDLDRLIAARKRTAGKSLAGAR